MKPQKFYSDYDTGTWCISMVDETGTIVGDILVDDLTTEQADDVIAALTWALEPPKWWLCVWCRTQFPYSDGPETLKVHSAACEAHPVNGEARQLVEVLRMGVAWFHADDMMRGEEGGAFVHWMQRADRHRLEFIAAAREAIDRYERKS